MLPVVVGLLSFTSSPILRARSSPACSSRCRVRDAFSPAFNSTVRYAAADWAKNMRTLPSSRLLRRIRDPLYFNVGVTFATCCVNARFGPLPNLLPFSSLVGPSLGLLLVFRTNAAYDRFWEARKAWGLVTSECRAMASLGCTFMTPQQALPMLSLIAAFPVVMKNYLRGGSEKAQQRDVRRLAALLASQEFEALTSVINQPQYVLARLRQLAQESRVAGVSEKEREMLIKSTGVLGDCLSTCERIYNTPIPLAYSRHTSRFLVLYVSTLPLALVGLLGWATLPAMATVCWALFGIFEIGNLIEEPFTATLSSPTNLGPLLPLTEVCRTIRRDVRSIAQYSQMARDRSVPTIQRYPSVKVLPDGFRQLRVLFAANATNRTRAVANSTANVTTSAANLL